MRIVTWNIEKRRQPEKLRPVLEGIAELSPDLVTLQEVVSGAVPPLLESLGGKGSPIACRVFEAVREI